MGLRINVLIPLGTVFKLYDFLGPFHIDVSLKLIPFFHSFSLRHLHCFMEITWQEDVGKVMVTYFILMLTSSQPFFFQHIRNNGDSNTKD